MKGTRGVALCAVVAAALALGVVVDRSTRRSELEEGPALRAGIDMLDAGLLAPGIEQQRAQRKKAFKFSDGMALQGMAHVQRLSHMDLAAVMRFVQKHDDEGKTLPESQTNEGADEGGGGSVEADSMNAEEETQDEMALANCNVPLDQRPAYCELLQDIGADLVTTKALYPTRATTAYRYKDNEGGYAVPHHRLIPVRLPNKRGVDLGQNVVQFGMPDRISANADGTCSCYPCP